MRLIYRKSHHRGRRISRSPKNNASSLGWVWLLFGIFLGITGSIGTYTTLIGNKSLEKVKALVSSDTNSTEVSKAEIIKPKIITPQNVASNNSSSKESAQKYEFYNLLPGMEVQLSDPVPAAKAPTTPPPSSSPVPSTPNTAKSSVTSEQENKSETNKAKEAEISRPTSIAESTAQSKNEPIVQAKLAAAQFIIQAGLFALSEDALQLNKQLNAKGFKTRLQKVKTKDGVTAYRVLLGPFANETLAIDQKKRLEQHRIHGILILKQR